MSVSNSETEPGTEEPGELDYVSQDKGGYLAFRHKHSFLSPAKKLLRSVSQGQLKNILTRKRNLLVTHKSTLARFLVNTFFELSDIYLDNK